MCLQETFPVTSFFRKPKEIPKGISPKEFTKQEKDTEDFVISTNKNPLVIHVFFYKHISASKFFYRKLNVI